MHSTELTDPHTAVYPVPYAPFTLGGDRIMNRGSNNIAKVTTKCKKIGGDGRLEQDNLPKSNNNR